MSSQLPSKNPTGYVGIGPTHPPQLHIQTWGPPATLHGRNFNIGDLWVDTAANQIWMLTHLVNAAGPFGIINATWTSIAAAAGVAITQLQGNVGGGILPILGICNLLGDGAAASGVLSTHTAGNTLTFSVQNADTAGHKGVSTFSNTYFSVSGLGVVTLANISGFTWNLAIAVQPITPNQGYYTTLPGLTTFVLPAVAAPGSIIRIQGASAGGWQLTQGAGQQIIFNGVALLPPSRTTAGAGGSCQSVDSYNGLDLLCIAANLTWVATNTKGNIFIV